jgi:hypothetical protein
MTIGINTSPLAGKSGKKLTARMVKDRLDKELVGNVSIRVNPPSAPTPGRCRAAASCSWRSSVEVMRREKFELTVGKPQVVTRTIDGKLHEPVERLTIDAPSDYQGVLMQLMALRKGRLEQMVDHGTGWIRLEYVVPARGLIGFRTEFLTETRGTGLLHHVHERLRAVVRRHPHPPDRLAGRRPQRPDHRLRAGQPAGPRHDVRRPRHRGLRGHDRRRELPVGRHGRQPDQGEEAHQHAAELGRHPRPAHPAPAALARAGARVVPRGRVRRGHAATVRIRKVILDQTGRAKSNRKAKAGV